MAPIFRTAEYTLLNMVCSLTKVNPLQLNPAVLALALANEYVTEDDDGNIILTNAGYDRLEELEG